MRGHFAVLFQANKQFTGVLPDYVTNKLNSADCYIVHVRIYNIII